jgi:hypothetical protein
MTSFFRFLHQTRSFSPFNTMDLAEFFRLYSGGDFSSSFLQWLYGGEETGTVVSSAQAPANSPPDLAPPLPLLEKYRISARSGKGGRP